MAKHKPGTGGNTQDIDAEKGKKPPKPKNIAQVTLIVRDDGKIAGDFWVWEEDGDLDRRKRWTVSGEDFFKFLNRVQPNNVKAVASCMNIQIVMAGLPEDLQGPWLTSKGGKLKVLNGDEIRELIRSKSPVGIGQGELLAEKSDKAAAEGAGVK